MNAPTTVLAASKASLLDLRESLARILGMQTVDLLIDRSVLEVGISYPQLRAIDLESGDLDLDGLDQSFAACTDEEVRAAFSALTGVVVLVLARLLGKQVAEGFSEALSQNALYRSVRI